MHIEKNESDSTIPSDSESSSSEDSATLSDSESGAPPESSRAADLPAHLSDNFELLNLKTLPDNQAFSSQTTDPTSSEISELPTSEMKKEFHADEIKQTSSLKSQDTHLLCDSLFQKALPLIENSESLKNLPLAAC